MDGEDNEGRIEIAGVEAGEQVAADVARDAGLQKREVFAELDDDAGDSGAGEGRGRGRGGRVRRGIAVAELEALRSLSEERMSRLFSSTSKPAAVSLVGLKWRSRRTRPSSTSRRWIRRVRAEGGKAKIGGGALHGSGFGDGDQGLEFGEHGQNRA